ncbi:sulfotransferase-like domain-containing protein [Anianabacter salinae]|uniref:sulfotransferase-like domain-containing protein n=1 Tax=Anianabacter salinae TaxID=2851023 RepID=UPI00225E5ED0|nr:HAD family hydrolase [Anianabacter salinae]MBV0913529.1 sulfotransferase [Anianabacter salinae]
MHLAVWSGPRNLSTALMYSFAARGDVAVWDEPFYSSYLTRTGLPHPMRDSIMAAGEPDAGKVIERLIGPVPWGKAHFYQKHMAQHMLPDIPRDWIMGLTNVFLIRHPARVVASFAKKREHPSFDELGFRQQADLFDLLVAGGKRPIVVDAADIKADPEAALGALCDRIGLAFSDRMLRWPAGGHPDDGVWAPVWYGQVHQSTGFEAEDRSLPPVEGLLADHVAQAMPFYETLYAAR